jgi:hypothetical protein
MRVSVPIGKVRARAFTIPTDKPEADGTIAWNSTTLIVVEVAGGDVVGLAYTYAAASITALIESSSPRPSPGLMRWIRRPPGARCSVPCAIGSRRTSRHRDFRGRCRFVRLEGPHPGPTPRHDARHLSRRDPGFTAVAASLPILTTSSRASSGVGCRSTVVSS